MVFLGFNNTNESIQVIKLTIIMHCNKLTLNKLVNNCNYSKGVRAWKRNSFKNLQRMLVK